MMIFRVVEKPRYQILRVLFKHHFGGLESVSLSLYAALNVGLYSIR